MLEVTKEIRDQTFEHQQQQIEALEQQREAIQKESGSLQQQATEEQEHTYECGDTVYIVRNGSYLKVGSTQDMNICRDSYVKYGGVDTEFLFTLRFHVSSVVENAVHNMLRAFALPDRPDWFNTDFEMVREAILAAHAIIDGSALVALEDKDAFYALLQKHNAIALQQSTPTPIEPEPPVELVASPLPAVLPPPPPVQAPVVDVSQIVVPERNHATDYARFLHECFESDSNSNTKTLLIQARYRAWSRSTGANFVEVLEYLANQGFTKGKIWDFETKESASAMVGLRMKPMPPFVMSDPPTDVEEFIRDECTILLTARVASKDIQTAFVDWKTRAVPNYQYSNVDKRALMTFLRKHFMKAVVHNGDRSQGGFYGLCLKGAELIGTHNKKSRRKPVYEFNPNTREVVCVYESCRHAAEALGTTEANISVACNNQRVIQGRYLSYVGTA